MFTGTTGRTKVKSKKEESVDDHAERLSQTRERYVWAQMAKRMSCGGCSNTTTVDSLTSCEVCGRMLCGHCGHYCEDHKE